jgi:hypothetical protein
MAGSAVRLRSSVTPERVLTFSAESWAAFIDGVRTGDFDR